MKRFLLLLLACTLFRVDSFGQLSVTTDIKSRYIWRGIDMGDSPNFQPGLTYKHGNLNLGVCGAYSFAGTGSVYAENDFWLVYDVPLSNGTVSFLCTDLFFPSAGRKFFNLKGDGTGAHTLEIGLQYVGPVQIPMAIRLYADAYNDPENSSYVEIAYPFTVDGISVISFLGFAGRQSVIYRTNGIGITNFGLTATKIVVVTESFTVPVSTSFIVNPSLEQSYVVFGVSF